MNLQENKTQLIHYPTGLKGVFQKEFSRPIYGVAIQIKLSNGREYVAPSSEFIITPN